MELDKAGKNILTAKNRRIFHPAAKASFCQFYARGA